MTMADARPTQPVDVAARCRHRFAIFEQRVFANSCGQGALSDAVRGAYETYLSDWDEQGSPWGVWVGKLEQARLAFAGLVGAQPGEIAVTTSTSAAVSAFASGLDFGKRSKVVLTDLEFPTIGQIWHAQELRGARVVHVAPDATGLVPLEHFDAAIDDDTMIVSVPHVSYRTGARIDVEAVAALAHERGALMLLDAYQTAGSLPLDVRALGVDLLTTGALKYLLGSAGLAYMWCRADLVERVTPTVTGWFADEDVAAMDAWDYSPARVASRFESGTPPVPALYAGIAGLQLIGELGVPAIAAHVRALNARLVDGVSELGGRVVTPGFRGALVCIAAVDEHALVDALHADGVIASSRDGNLRISLHAYNDVGDVDAILAALARHRALLA
jgi:selenocysteine lyase/cysteine desulfurase